ncbi:hypothetical protein B0H14DRAFT_3518901 [Mycena olivaceomarginata]|nr:hypothetical protein B0H14DRAFT_3518901 [Mycena olivaceomarginata]
MKDLRAFNVEGFYHLNIDPLPTRMTRMSQRPLTENLKQKNWFYDILDVMEGAHIIQFIDLNLSADSPAAFALPEAREDIPYVVRLSSTIAWTRSALTRRYAPLNRRLGRYRPPPSPRSSSSSPHTLPVDEMCETFSSPSASTAPLHASSPRSMPSPSPCSTRAGKSRPPPPAHRSPPRSGASERTTCATSATASRSCSSYGSTSTDVSTVLLRLRAFTVWCFDGAGAHAGCHDARAAGARPRTSRAVRPPSESNPFCAGTSRRLASRLLSVTSF